MSAMLQPAALGAGCGSLRPRAGVSACSLPRPIQHFRNVQLDRYSLSASPLGLRASWQFPQSPTTAPRQQQQHQPRQQVCTAALPAVAAAAQAVPHWDLLCGVAAAVCSFVWVKIFDLLKRAGVLEQKLSRKLVHITTGPIFVLTWLFFSDAPYARFIAASVPSINAVRLLAVGSGLMSDPGLVKSMSRSGDKAELLRGPLYYVGVLVAVTMLFWRDNPAGLITVSMMCGGDGIADIIGRRFGTAKLPWNFNKSWVGSAAMFGAGMAMACGYFLLFCSQGYFECFPLRFVLPYLAVVCGACTVVESLPVNTWFDDNLSVPLVAAGTSMLVLPLAAAAAAGCSLPQPHYALPMLHLG